MLLFLNSINNDDQQIELEEIYKAYRKQMALTAFSVVHNKSDAEDAVHDVFLRIASNNHMDLIQELKNPNDLRNYLLKAAKNSALNIQNRNKVHKDLLSDLDFSEDSEEIPELSDNDFLNRLCTKLEYDALVEAILSLDERYREIMYYHFVMELTVVQAAKLLGKKIPTAKKLLVRGKKLLLTAINNKGEIDYVNEQRRC